MRRWAREKTERTEEPLVGVNRATSKASFRDLKITSYNNNYIRSYVEGSIFKLCSLNMSHGNAGV